MRMQTSSASRGRRAEGGSILGVSAIAMLAILGVVGLAVDISHLYLVAAELQNAADAAALAGASALNGGAGGIEIAVTRATEAMNRYEFNKTAVGITEPDIAFAANLSEFDSGSGVDKATAMGAGVAPTIRFVKVSIPAKSITTLVGQAFLDATSGEEGTNEFVVARSAVAGQSVPINNFCNFAPFSVVYDDTNNLPLHPGTTCTELKRFFPGCTYTIRLPSGNGNSNGGGPTTAANDKGGGGGGGGGGGETGSGISAGNYLLLAIGSDRGGSDLRSRLGIGVDSCYQTNQTVSTEPGLTAGPVRQGLNTRFDDFQGGGMSTTEFPPDLNVKANITYSQYKSGSKDPSVYQAPTHPGQADRRVLVIPIINASSYDSGRNEVTIASFGRFFLRNPVANGNGGEITAEYIDDNITVGNGGYVIGGGPGIPGFTVPVLYR